MTQLDHNFTSKGAVKHKFCRINELFPVSLRFYNPSGLRNCARLFHNGCTKLITN